MKIFTQKDAVQVLVEQDVKRWGESKRASATRSYNKLSLGLLLLELASRAQSDGKTRKAAELRAAADRALTNRDLKAVRERKFPLIVLLAIAFSSSACNEKSSDEVEECQMSVYASGLDKDISAILACQDEAVRKSNPFSYCRANGVVTTDEVYSICEEYPDNCDAGVYWACDARAIAYYDACYIEAVSLGVVPYGCLEGLLAYFDACYEASAAECRYLLG